MSDRNQQANNLNPTSDYAARPPAHGYSWTSTLTLSLATVIIQDLSQVDWWTVPPTYEAIPRDWYFFDDNTPDPILHL